MKLRYLKIDFTRPRSWRDRAPSLAEWERWDCRMRRRFGWRAGLSFWSRTNTPGQRVLLSRHWPHRVCWSWSISFGRRREGWHGPRHFSFVASRKDRFMGLWLWVMYVNMSYQDIAPFVQRHSITESGQRKSTVR
jgi:hypothetical protein